jgi:hypothetical protein
MLLVFDKTDAVEIQVAEWAIMLLVKHKPNINNLSTLLQQMEVSDFLGGQYCIQVTSKIMTLE